MVGTRASASGSLPPGSASGELSLERVEFSLGTEVVDLDAVRDRLRVAETVLDEALVNYKFMKTTLIMLEIKQEEAAGERAAAAANTETGATGNIDSDDAN